MTAQTETNITASHASFGPSEGISAPTGARGAMLTLVLALYPVVAAIMVMMAGLAIAAPH